MNNEEFDRSFEGFKSFLKAEPIVPLLTRNLGYLLQKNKLVDTVEVNDELHCYTKRNKIVVSGADWLMRDGYDKRHWSAAMRVFLAREVQHDYSSDREILKSLREWCGEYLYAHFGLDRHIGQVLGHKILNVLEDGRVNDIVCRRFPGYLPMMRFTNYARCGSMEPECELAELICDIESYALTGLSFTGGSRLFYEISGLIDEAVLTQTAAECGAKCRELLERIGARLAKLCGGTENLEAYIDRLREELHEYAFSEADRAEVHGDASASGVRVAKQEKIQNGESEDGEDPDLDKASSGTPGSSDNSTRQGDESGSLTDEQAKPKNGAGLNGREDRGESYSYGRSKNHGGGNGAVRNSDDSASEKAKNQGPTSIRDVLGAQRFDRESPALTQDELLKMLQTSEEELLREAANEKKCHVEAAGKSPISLHDKSVLKKLYSNVEFTEKSVQPYSRQLPSEYLSEAKNLHRKLDRILNEQRVRTANQRKGALSRKGLWKAEVGEKDVFQRKTPPTAKETAFYLLIDRSGSMGMGYGNGNSKLFTALMTAAVIEEALKGLAYTKIAAFDGGLDSAEHFVVKDFQQKEVGNRCFDALTQVSAGNGNKDGYSIRVAGMELEKRSERLRILVVLSDGLPSAYIREDEAIADVRAAVQDTRRRGVIVIPIIYGSADAKNDYAAYEKMYEKGIISTTPENVLAEFEKLLLRLIR